MTLSIQNLNIGSHTYNPQGILPVQQTYLKKLLSKYFQDITGKETFSLKQGSNGTTLSLGDRKVVVLDKDDLKQANQLIRYYQHVGQLPRQELSAEEFAGVKKSLEKALINLHQANLPGPNDQILAGIRIADDSLAVIRNIMYALPFVGTNDPIANHLGYYAGVVWTFFSFKEIEQGFEELARSKLIGDAEGERRAKARLLSGGIVSTASLTYLMGKICDTFVSTAIASALSGAADVLFGVGSVLAMGVSGLGAYRCYRFNEKINEYIENPNLSEKEKMQGALHFLQDQISVTAKERKELIDRIEKEWPNLSLEKKEELLQQKVNDLLETKVKALRRRTGSKSIHLIQTQVDSILAKLSNEKTLKEGIAEAALLIHTVQTESRTQMILHILGFIAALISFIALLTGMVFTAGALPFILYGISGTIYLALTVHSISQMCLNKETQNKGIDLGPMSYMSPQHPL